MNLVASKLLETSRLLRNASFHQVQEISPSSFSGLHHLTLMIDPTQCFFGKPSQLNNLMAEIADHSQLESLYLGFISGFGRMGTDPEDSISLCLSSMQHLNTVHLDSFWPALLELPPRASLHATFRPASGQKHPGLWAGRPADVQNQGLPLRSVHFLLYAGLGAEHAMTAKELWPLRVKCSDLFRVLAGAIDASLAEVPGLLQAERVLITASTCQLRIPGNQVAFKHLTIRVSERLGLSITNPVAFAAQVETLTITCKHSMEFKPMSAVLRNAMLAAGKRVVLNCSRTQCKSKGRKQPQSFVRGGTCLHVGSDAMHAGEWAHAMRCCCHAYLACLHRDGAAAFPEAIAQEEAMFGA